MIRHSDYIVAQGPHLTHGGARKLYRYPNGRGASVVMFEWSYGGQQGLWEAVPIVFLGEDDIHWQMSGDPQGYLTDSELDRYLDEIAAEPPVDSSSL